MPPDGTEGPDNAELPGLDDTPASSAKSGEPQQPPQPPDTPRQVTDEPTGPDWSDAELDEWFENDFGGDRAFNEFATDGGGYRMTPDSHPDLYFGFRAYRQLAYDDEWELDGEAEPWRLLSHEAKRRFRQGWENTQGSAASLADELAPYDAMKTLVDARHKLAPKPTRPRWIFVGGGIGILGLVLVVGLVLGGRDADQDAAAPPTEAPAEDSAPPVTELIVDATEALVVAVDTPGTSAVPFPTRWSYTATKTADIVPAPEYMTPTPIGATLPWAFNVAETCGEDVCTYATVLLPMMPDSLLGGVPESTWVIDGSAWSLDVTYQTVQSRYDDGTVCVIANRDVFELAVTEEVIDGRSIPEAFEGTWIQAISLDLAASTGDTATYCGESWEVVDEWSLVGDVTS